MNRIYSHIFAASTIALLTLTALNAEAATFGKVVTIGGQASDLALDEGRGVLYIANYTGNRIDVLSLADGKLRPQSQSIPAYPQPISIALSRDGRYLAAVHYGNYEGTATDTSGLTFTDLTANTTLRVNIPGSQMFAVAFGNSSDAVVATSTGAKLISPVNGAITDVPAVLQLPPPSGGALPCEWGVTSQMITGAVATVSRDGNVVQIYAQNGKCAFGEADTTTGLLKYVVPNKRLFASGVVSKPGFGPRLISTDQDGSTIIAGWAALDGNGVLRAEFPRTNGDAQIGSHVIDPSRQLIYAQIPTVTGTSTNNKSPEPPILHVMDFDNLTVRERLNLAEDLTGRAVLTADAATVYAISSSGVTILPVGSLDKTARTIAASAEDLVFQSNACDRRTITQFIDIADRNGNQTDFTVVLPQPVKGVRVSPVTGTTPARVQIDVDPTAFQASKGTTAVQMDLFSLGAVNVPMPVRLLVNTREPEQKGTMVNVPGKIVDALADVPRNRFYLLRQDQNQVLVYDSADMRNARKLRTRNTPVGMALTQDNRYLLVGGDHSQYVDVFDMSTLEKLDPIILPFGTYGRTLAGTSDAIWATVRTAFDPAGELLKVDLAHRSAAALPWLGIFKNDIDPDSVITASASGKYMLLAQPDGKVALYDADWKGFTTKDYGEALSGGYAVLGDDLFAVGSTVYNTSLVPVATLEGDSTSSGFATNGGLGLRLTSTGAADPGILENVDLQSYSSVAPTLLAESPVTAGILRTPPISQIGQSILPFTRTVAPLTSDSTNGPILVRSISGVTVVAGSFAQPLPTPVISGVVNSADFTGNVAPGGLITISGAYLTTTGGVASDVPLPTSLGEMCATVNNVPLPLFSVGSSRIQAQLPFEASGTANLVVRTTAGVSAPFGFDVQTSAPAIFRLGTAGDQTGLPLIYRAANEQLATLTNPVRPNDILIIYATGLGATGPAVENGYPAPSDVLARAVTVPTITLGGVPLAVQFAGLAPGQVGVYQMNVAVPSIIPDAVATPLRITTGTYTATMNVRTVNAQ